MAIYYIDIENGKNENDGLSEKTSVADYKKIDIKPGDTVLFKRGSFIREKLWVCEGGGKKSTLSNGSTFEMSRIIGESGM